MEMVYQGGVSVYCWDRWKSEVGLKEVGAGLDEATVQLLVRVPVP